MMYNNIKSIVINNENTSEYYKMVRGVKQSCPISANILILVLKF